MSAATEKSVGHQRRNESRIPTGRGKSGVTNSPTSVGYSPLHMKMNVFASLLRLTRYGKSRE